MKRSELLAAIAKIIEHPTATPTTVLCVHTFDSMAVVMIVGEIDIICEKQVQGVDVGKCVTVGEILTLAGV